MTVILFALTGCVDDNDAKFMMDTQLRLSNEVAYLHARISAVEEACLQINERLNVVEGHKGSPGSTSKAQEKSVTPSSDGEYFDKLTRVSFSQRVVGMKPEKITAMFGKPDRVSREGDKQSWIYHNIKLTTEDGGQEQSPAMIVFEQGLVARDLLTEDVQYNSALKDKESGNTATGANQ